MANLLDIRRRIRSVKNTRQITKAMQMVSAAKLRRAQERALAARPYAQMLTNVLKSLVSRADTFDEQTGEPTHPMLLRREENNVLLIVVDEILPNEQIGEADVRQAEGMSEEERKRVIEAAKKTGASVREADTTDIDKKAAEFGASQVDYIYEQSPRELFGALLPKYMA